MNKLIILLFMALISCDSSEPNESIAAKTKPIPSASENIKSELFQLISQFRNKLKQIRNLKFLLS